MSSIALLLRAPDSVIRILMIVGVCSASFGSFTGSILRSILVSAIAIVYCFPILPWDRSGVMVAQVALKVAALFVLLLLIRLDARK